MISLKTYAQDIPSDDHELYDSLFYEYFELIDRSPDSALTQARLLYSRVYDSQDPYMIGYTHYLRAEALSALEEYALAISQYEAALDVFLESTDSTGLGYVYHGLGVLSGYLGRVEDAIQFTKQGLEHDTSEIDDVFVSWNNLARDLIYLERFDEAQVYIKKLKTQFKRGEDSAGFYEGLECEADLHFYKGAYEQSLKKVKQCYRFQKSQGLVGYLSGLHLYMAEIYLEMGEMDKASIELEKARVIEEEVTPGLSSEYYTILLEEYHLAKGNYKEAYSALAKYADRQNKKEQLNSTGLFQVLKNQFDFENKLASERQAQELIKKEATLKLNASRKSRYYLLAILTLIVVIAIIMVVALSKFSRLNRRLKTQNQQIERKNSELSQNNIVKEKLIGLIAHDTRSPLAATTSGLEMVNSGDLDGEDSKELMHALEKNAKSSLEELDAVIQWARAQQEGIELVLEVVQLEPLVENLVANVQNLFLEKRVKFRADVFHSCEVYGDATLLKHTLKNLMINAGKFSNEDSEVLIKTRGDSRECHIDVEDHGVGMNADELSSLFSFEAKSRLGTKKEKGTGLGLLQCHEFVTRMGGSIDVTSTTGAGTTFTVTLPKASDKKVLVAE